MSNEVEEWEKVVTESLVKNVRDKMNNLINQMTRYGVVDDDTIQQIVKETVDEVLAESPPKPVIPDNALVKYLEK
jgi:hypothetical protein